MNLEDVQVRRMVGEAVTKAPGLDRGEAERLIRKARIEEGQFGATRLVVALPKGLGSAATLTWEWEGTCPTCKQDVRFRSE